MRLRYLLDTNVLVYAHDGSEPAKRLRARDVLARVGGQASGALPAQALGEFASVVLRKLSVLEGVRFIDPFAPELEVSTL